MQALDLLLHSLLLIGSFVFLSIWAWGAGYLTLKLRRGELKVNDLPKWLQDLGSQAIQPDSPGDKLAMIAPYFSMGTGLLIIGALIIISTWSWYRYGFNQDVIAEGVAFFVWGLIVRWFLRLGR